MKGARGYAELFETGQYGRLYIVSSYHARGKTFRIFVLPEGEDAIPNGPNAPLNKDKVEVYGVVDGNPGWSETYGWKHFGKWQDDFQLLVTQRLFEKSEGEAITKLRIWEAEQNEKNRQQQLLSTY